MTAIGLVTLWVLAALGPGLLPARRRLAIGYLLVAFGVPILGLVTFDYGPVWGLGLLAVGAAILRWPPLVIVRGLLHARRDGVGKG